MQTKDRGFPLSVARARARVAFDHALGSEMSFNSVAYSKDIAVVPEPLRTLGAKTKTFETETNTRLAVVVLIGFLVTLLTANPARVTARLSAHGTLAFGRSGLFR